MLIDSAVDRLREAREAFPDVPLFLFGRFTVRKGR
jgi:hypothetical protein